MKGRSLQTRLARAGRAVWRELSSGPSRHSRSRTFQTPYRGAAVSRTNTDWIPGLTTSDTELRDSLRLLRWRGRDLARNSSTAKGFNRQAKSNIIGPTGFSSRPQVRDARGELAKGTNATILAAFKEWSDGPVSLDRRLNLPQLYQLAVENLFTEGELLVRFVRGTQNPFGFSLQLIDPDCLDETYNVPMGPRQNEIRMGVEVDANGAPVGYWLWDLANYSGIPINRRRYFVAAYNPFTRTGEMLHIFIPARINQTRGPSMFHSVMERVHQMGAYSESELFSSRVGASPIGFIIPGEEAEEPEDADPEDDAGENAEGELHRPARATDPNSIVADPAAFFRLHKGETIEQWKAEHPTTQIVPFMKLMLQDVATGLGAQYFELANDLEGVNFTSSRTGTVNQRDVWRLLQAFLISALHRYVYDEWLGLALLTGALKLPGRSRAMYAAVKHAGRGWDWVKPLEDTQTGALALQCGLTSRQRLLAMRGEDFEEVLEELMHERELAAEYGVPIEPPSSLAADIEKAQAADVAAAAAQRDEDEGRTKTSAGTNGDGNGGPGGKRSHDPASVLTQAGRRSPALRF